MPQEFSTLRPKHRHRSAGGLKCRTTADCPSAQRGFALLLLVFLGAGLAASLFLLPWTSQHTARKLEQKTEQALLAAKEALIAHALVYGETHRTLADPGGGKQADDITLPPGTLPCPETTLNVTGEGSQNGSCNNRDVSALGRFPWRSLGTGPLRDGNGDCLWYAVSGAYKANPAPYLLNWDSPGAFEIRDEQNTLIATDVVAVVISPGSARAGQDRKPLPGARQCGGNYTASAYLDTASLGGKTYNNAIINPAANGKTIFITGRVQQADGEVQANDRIAYITRDDLFAHAIERRSDFARQLYDATDRNGDDTQKSALAQKIAACLANYGRHNASPDDKRLPWAAPLTVADFDNDSFDDVSHQYAGRPPYRVGTSRSTTNNTLVPAGCSATPDNCRLLIVERCLAGWWRVAGQPLESNGTSRQQSPEGWWAKWKDHFYYILSPEFAPNSNNDWANNPNPCTASSQCITVGTNRYAAVLAFAGKALPGQQRQSLADRQNAANYLDGSNALALTNPGTARPRSLTPTGNDQLVCIKPDLTVDSTCH